MFKGLKISNDFQNVPQDVLEILVGKVFFDLETAPEVASIYVKKSVFFMKGRRGEKPYFGINCKLYECYVNPEYVNVLKGSPKTDFTFVMQGLPKGWITEIARNLCFQSGDVVDAVWKHNESQSVQNRAAKNGITSHQNIYPQCVSSLNGIRQVTTRFAVKCRSDEYYGNLLSMTEEVQASPEKMVTNNIFVRRIRAFPFHMSDHLIGGTTVNMLGLFETALKALEERRYGHLRRSAEQHICLSFLDWKRVPYDMRASHIEIKNVMLKHFAMVSARNLIPFYLSANCFSQCKQIDDPNNRYFKDYANIERLEDL